jgi:hypothetical protein
MMLEHVPATAAYDRWFVSTALGDESQQTVVGSPKACSPDTCALPVSRLQELHGPRSCYGPNLNALLLNLSPVPPCYKFACVCIFYSHSRCCPNFRGLLAAERLPQAPCTASFPLARSGRPGEEPLKPWIGRLWGPRPVGGAHILSVLFLFCSQVFAGRVGTTATQIVGRLPQGWVVQQFDTSP